MPPKRKKVDEDDDYVQEHDEDDFGEPGVGRGRGVKGKFQKGAPGRGRLAGASSMSNLVDEIPQFQDYSKVLKLKSDHDKRPIWVTKDNLIILEAFSPIYKQAYDFVVAIAEPESRPEYVHCYRLTENSLYAAVAVFDTESIIKFLGRLCKTDLPPEVANYVRECTYTFGKAKIVLKDNKFYIESKYQEILRELLKNPIIRNARVMNEADKTATAADSFVVSAAPVEDSRNVHNLNVSLAGAELDYTKMGVEEMDNDDEEEHEGGDLGEEVMKLTSSSNRGRTQTVSFMIARESVQVSLFFALFHGTVGGFLCVGEKLFQVIMTRFRTNCDLGFLCFLSVGEAQRQGGVPVSLDGGI